MNWDVRFLKEAAEDFNRLDSSQQKIVSKALLRVSQNPLPANEGGYGKPLGNHTASNLSGLLKIKLRAHGLRVVYQLIRMNHQMLVIVIGIRADGQVYSEAQERMDKLK